MTLTDDFDSFKPFSVTIPNKGLNRMIIKVFKASPSALYLSIKGNHNIEHLMK